MPSVLSTISISSPPSCAPGPVCAPVLEFAPPPPAAIVDDLQKISAPVANASIRRGRREPPSLEDPPPRAGSRCEDGRRRGGGGSVREVRVRVRACARSKKGRREEQDNPAFSERRCPSTQFSHREQSIFHQDGLCLPQLSKVPRTLTCRIASNSSPNPSAIACIQYPLNATCLAAARRRASSAFSAGVFSGRAGVTPLALAVLSLLSLTLS